MHVMDFLLPGGALLLLSVILLPRVREIPFWRASITPFASIIGSGFLIVAPLLGKIVGPETPWAMLLIVVVAYLIGGVIRFNIRYAEPRLASGAAPSGQRFVEHLSNWGLLGAYVISVAFYLRLMSAFVLRGFDVTSETSANALTTLVLLFIGITGWRRGLKGLERLELFSVSIKLVIIVAFLVGLAFHDAGTSLWVSIPHPPARPVGETLRMLAGMLLVVQGFETSRYLGHVYSADMRVRSMRFAQQISAVIYISFAFMILPLIQYLSPAHFHETAIIDLSRHVSVVLPFMLIIAASMSQFSAAIADTLGGGGLIADESRTKVSARIGYITIAVCAIVLVWTTSIFEIIAFASRAFAFYYFGQTVLAFQIASGLPNGRRRWLLLLGFGLLSGVLAWVTLYAIPVG